MSSGRTSDSITASSEMSSFDAKKVPPTRNGLNPVIIQGQIQHYISAFKNDIVPRITLNLSEGENVPNIIVLGSNCT